MSKSPSPPTIKPFNLFLNARCYQLAAMAIDRQEPRDLYVRPLFVNMAFSTELYLKCLHFLRGQTARGHDLLKLFNNLSKADRESIERHFDGVIKQHPQHATATSEGVLLDLASVLTRVGEFFEKERYWHEGDVPRADFNNYRGNAGLDSLCDAVARTILDIHPDWFQKSEQFKCQFPPGTKLTT